MPGPERIPRLGWALLLVCLALAWRLPYAAAVSRWQVDEAVTSMPTIRQIQQGEWPIYVFAAAYMAPLHEALSAALFAPFGESLLTFRLPATFFGALAAGLAFLALCEAVPVAAALGLALLLACGNSFVCTYTTFSIPCWGGGVALVAGLQILTFWLDQKRALWRWAIFGLAAGVAAYIFKLSILQSAVSAGWLGWRSDIARAYLDRRRGDPRLRRRSAVTGASLVVAAAALLPVLYRFLTRRQDFHPHPAELALASLALLAGGTAAWRAVVDLRPPRAAWTRTAAFALAFGLAYLPVTQYFDHAVRPRLESRGTPLHDAASYSWKNRDAWPLQGRLFLERIIPTLLLGRADLAAGGEVTAVPFTWRTAASAGLLAAIAALLARAFWWRGARADWLADPAAVLIGPVLLVTALMLPSWNLHNDFCARYFIPFLGGIFLAAGRLLQPWLAPRPRFAAALVAGYALYCGIDCARFIW